MPPYRVIAFLFLAMSLLPSFGAERDPTPLEIIARDGMLCISDGSSIYGFQKDGTFSSMPTNISGRTIQGKWSTLDKASSSGVQFVIEGQWGWVNGMSPNNDFRMMTITVHAPFGSKVESTMWPVDFGLTRGNVYLRIYDCYFLIDELKKKP